VDGPAAARVIRFASWARHGGGDGKACCSLAAEIPLAAVLSTHTIPATTSAYQTLLPGRPGAVAAPTAGSISSDALLKALADRGVELTGSPCMWAWAPSAPFEDEDLTALELHSEWVAVKPEAVAGRGAPAGGGTAG